MSILLERPLPANKEHVHILLERPLPDNKEHVHILLERPLPDNKEHVHILLERPLPANTEHIHTTGETSSRTKNVELRIKFNLTVYPRKIVRFHDRFTKVT